MIHDNLIYFTLFLSIVISQKPTQEEQSITKIEYQQGCSFCASQKFTAALYVYQSGSFYTFKHDPSAELSNSNHTVIIDTSTNHIRYDRTTDSLYELAGMRSINPAGILIGEKRKPIVWNLIDSNRVINGHACKLAIGDFRGRQYRAWYDPSVKINLGPWKLHGLPGAIVYASDTTGELYFKAHRVSELKSTSLARIVKKPNLPIVGRLRYRALREKVYEDILNFKPKEETNVTFEITMKKNYFEFE